MKATLWVVGWLLCSTTLKAQVPSGAKWKLEKEGSGIKVYTAPAAKKMKYIKAQADMNGTLEGVKAVFRDISKQKTWVYGTQQAYLVKKINDDQLLYYNETDLPWPASNRDVAIRMTLKAAPTQLTIIQKDEPGAVPPQKGIERVPHLHGRWEFHEAGNGQLKVEYYLDVDPGGSLPAWIVNMFATRGPYQTLVKLRELVKQ